MRVVFVTHNRLGLACLEELAELGANIQGIFTRPEADRISDQEQFTGFAEAHDVSLYRVESLNTAHWENVIQRLEPELLFVVGWSRLVEKRLLDIPTVAALGMHPAPLPRGRGRAPIAWSLIKGLDQTKLSFFHLVEEADAGDIVGQHPINIEIEDDAASLYDKVVAAGRELIQEYYPQFASGSVPRVEQDEGAATWWPKREPHHGLIDWNQPAMEVYNWIRGQTRPYPGAFSYLDSQKVTVWGASPPDDERRFVKPGEIHDVIDDGVIVGTWEGVIELTELQVDGESLTGREFMRAAEAQVGDSFSVARDLLQ